MIQSARRPLARKTPIPDRTSPCHAIYSNPSSLGIPTSSPSVDDEPKNTDEVESAFDDRQNDCCSTTDDDCDEFTLEPRPVLPVPDESMSIERRIYARFDFALDIKETENEITVLDNECEEIPDDLIQPDDPIPNSGAADEAGDRLERIRKVQDCLGRLFSPASGKPLSPQQRKDVIELLDAGLKCEGVSITEIVDSTPSRTKNIEVLIRQQLSAMTSGDGWTSRVFEVQGGKATAHWNSQAIKSIADKVKELYPFIETRPLWDGERYGHPATGEYMKDFHNIIQSQREFLGDWNEGTDFPLLLTYFSDATLLANRGSASAHPVVVGIGNLPQRMYAGNLITVGYLETTIQYSLNLSKDEKRQVKKALVAQQVSAMMEQFVRASYMGYQTDLSPGPRGETHQDHDYIRFFPGLFHAALDYPEVVSILGIKTGSCGICYWNAGLGGPTPSDKERFAHGVTVHRSEKRSRESWSEMNGISKKPGLRS